MKKLWHRLRDVVVHQILGLDDTPHRIAWGVFLGFVVGWTPTLGFQILIYVAVATLLRANKVSGIPPVFITNPFTAVPLYYLCWKVGSYAMHGSVGSGMSREVLKARFAVFEGQNLPIFDLEFWRLVGSTLVDMGAELWVGSFILGILNGIPAYVLTYWGVIAYRRRLGQGQIEKVAAALTPSQRHSGEQS